MDEYKDLFEKVVEGNTTKIIPKETLKIDLKISVSFNPIFLNLHKYKVEDNYHIVWGSLKNYPEFDIHPIFQSYNKRSEHFYIYKTDNTIHKVKIIRKKDNDETW